MSTKSYVYPYEFDSRMVEWNLKHKLITRDQLKSYLSTLPDSAANSTTVELEEGSGDFDNSDADTEGQA